MTKVYFSFVGLLLLLSVFNIALCAEDSWCDRHKEGPTKPHIYCDHQPSGLDQNHSQNTAKSIADAIVKTTPIKKEKLDAIASISSLEKRALKWSCYRATPQSKPICQPACQMLNLQTGEWQSCP